MSFMNGLPDDTKPKDSEPLVVVSADSRPSVLSVKKPVVGPGSAIGELKNVEKPELKESDKDATPVKSDAAHSTIR